MKKYYKNKYVIEILPKHSLKFVGTTLKKSYFIIFTLVPSA